MDIISLIIFLAVGALAGWLAGNIVKGSGFGVVANIIVGIIGAVLGGFRFARYNHWRLIRLDYYGHHWRCYFVIYCQHH